MKIDNESNVRRNSFKGKQVRRNDIIPYQEAEFSTSPDAYVKLPVELAAT